MEKFIDKKKEFLAKVAGGPEQGAEGIFNVVIPNKPNVRKVIELFETEFMFDHEAFKNAIKWEKFVKLKKIERIKETSLWFFHHLYIYSRFYAPYCNLYLIVNL